MLQCTGMPRQSIPGTFLEPSNTSVKSIPDIIRQMEEMAQTKISNDIASANLVSALLDSAADNIYFHNLYFHKDQW